MILSKQKKNEVFRHLRYNLEKKQILHFKDILP